ncbi:uncharacterized protein B0H18DRAFT_1026705 [Fomitopsis serialis]|uniref:uncharacterized protein n=1 Tax=Fomitopsis serialis TaxID=139415 RepID=UPI0020089A9B|nr:uncharacterized protein B0H18DRAFT_1026705 [Neoantrodia serialis]KAH9919690.1 hypothetical protein B0H18DRAFT_1026705 [Neoantrodia serialis]
MQSGHLFRSLRRVPPLLRQPCRLSSSAASSDVKPYYITTPIFYPNSVPHIGHLYSLVVADIFARYARLRHPNRPVHFTTGTDEHGLKIKKAAQAQGMEPLPFCDTLSEHFKGLVQKADISSTRFSRTTERGHCDAVQYLWRRLDAKGLLYKDIHSGWYSVSDECFYPELQVTKVVDAAGNEQHEKTTIPLVVFPGRPGGALCNYREAIHPPQHHEAILHHLRTVTLQDLSVSRPRSRLTWGVPVPNDDEHTIYVWIDALTVYLSSIGFPWTDDGKGLSSGWPSDIQVIGKDILRFHALYFPAMLAALDLPFPQKLLAHSHWTMDHRKMSKSVGNVVDPIAAIDEYGIDVVRYYLAEVGGRFKDDVDWSPHLVNARRTEITSMLGNLLARSTSKALLARIDLSKRLVYGRDPSLSDRPLVAILRTLPCDVDAAMSELRIADALAYIRVALNTANILMTDTRPWAKATPASEVQAVSQVVLDCLRICGVFLQPFMPAKATALLDTLGIPEDCRTWEYAHLARPPPSTGIRSGVILFSNSKSSGPTRRESRNPHQA